MRKPLLRRVVFLLLFALAAGWIRPAPARAADEGGANNMTLGLVAVVAAVALIVAWQMDFSKEDDMITRAGDLRLDPAGEDRLAVVVTDWHAADEDRAEVVSGIGLRAWF